MKKMAMSKVTTQLRLKDSVHEMCACSVKCLEPGPVCSVWPADSVHHEDPPGHPGNGTAGMSSSGQQCQMWSGRRGPWVPNIQEQEGER